MFEMEEEIGVKQGNYGYPLKFSLREYVDDAWQAKDLTGYTVTLKVWVPEATDLYVTGDCTLDADPTTGICYYSVQSGDFDEVPEVPYNGELELTKAGVVVDTYTFKLIVLETAPTPP